MKFYFVPLLVTLCLPFNGWSDHHCIAPDTAGMPEVHDVLIPGSSFSITICYQPEPSPEDAAPSPYYRDLIVFKEGAKQVASQATQLSVTEGRISNLTLEKATNRFVSVSYDAGEFCNGIVFFDSKERRSAASLSCVSSSDICRVVRIDDLACTAQVECIDSGAEGEPPTRKEPLRRSLSLCSEENHPRP